MSRPYGCSGVCTSGLALNIVGMTDDERDPKPDHGESEEGGGSADSLPPSPDSDDPTPLGDTDQHSDSDA